MFPLLGCPDCPRSAPPPPPPPPVSMPVDPGDKIFGIKGRRENKYILQWLFNNQPELLHLTQSVQDTFDSSHYSRVILTNTAGSSFPFSLPVSIWCTGPFSSPFLMWSWTILSIYIEYTERLGYIAMGHSCLKSKLFGFSYILFFRFNPSPFQPPIILYPFDGDI